MKNLVLGLIIAFAFIPTAFAEASNTSCIVLSADLRQGAGNANVASLQNFLVTNGYLRAKATGFFGPATLAAVKGFQKANGLNAAGFVGPQTRARIAAMSCAAASAQVIPPATVPAPAPSAPAAPSSPISPLPPDRGPFGNATSGGGSQATGTVYPDPKAAYLKMHADYDAAQTIDAFMAVSIKYATAARQADIAAEKADMQDLSPSEKDDFFTSNIKAIVPKISEIGDIGVVQNGGTATLLILPLQGSGKDAKGLVVLNFENGTWKLQSEKWQTPAGLGVETIPSAAGG